MDKLVFKRYAPGNPLIHRLDPHSKPLAMILYIVIIFWTNNVVTNIIMVASTLTVVLLSEIKSSFFLKSVQPMAGIILFTTLFQMLSIQGSRTYFQFDLLKMTSHGFN